MNGIKITIGETEYNLRFGINVLCDMSRAGIDVYKLLTNVDILAIRTLFYYSLKSDIKKMTENRAGDLMDEYISSGKSLDDITTAVMEALALSMGTKFNNEEDSSEEEAK